MATLQRPLTLSSASMVSMHHALEEECGVAQSSMGLAPT